MSIAQTIRPFPLRESAKAHAYAIGLLLPMTSVPTAALAQDVIVTRHTSGWSCTLDDSSRFNLVFRASRTEADQGIIVVLDPAGVLPKFASGARVSGKSNSFHARDGAGNGLALVGPPVSALEPKMRRASLTVRRGGTESKGMCSSRQGIVIDDTAILIGDSK